MPLELLKGFFKLAFFVLENVKFSAIARTSWSCPRTADLYRRLQFLFVMPVPVRSPIQAQKTFFMCFRLGKTKFSRPCKEARVNKRKSQICKISKTFLKVHPHASFRTLFLAFGLSSQSHYVSFMACWGPWWARLRVTLAHVAVQQTGTGEHTPLIIHFMRLITTELT